MKSLETQKISNLNKSNALSNNYFGTTKGGPDMETKTDGNTPSPPAPPTALTPYNITDEIGSNDDSDYDNKNITFNPKVNVGIDFGTDGTAMSYSFVGSNDVYIYDKWKRYDITRGGNSKSNKQRTAILLCKDGKFKAYGENAVLAYVINIYPDIYFKLLCKYMIYWETYILIIIWIDMVQWRVVMTYFLIISKCIYIVCGINVCQ